jgi:O-Antigen ligase
MGCSGGRHPQPTGTESARSGRPGDVADAVGRTMTARPGAASRRDRARDGNRRPRIEAATVASLGFYLFVLVNAALFIRPSEIVPGLEEIPIYHILILSCLLVSLPAVRRELTRRRLVATPISACVLGMLAAVMLSHLSHYNLSYTRDAAVGFIRAVLYYLLLVAVLNSPSRLRRFLVYLAGMIGVVAVLSLLHYHGFVTIPSMKVVERTEADTATGELYTVHQLYGTGIFADPNDLSLILTIGMGLCLCQLEVRRSARRWLWVVPLVVFAYTLFLTKSRGGFLAMLGCILATCWARYGWKRSAAIAAVVLPVILVLFAGRQTDLSTTRGTGQQRVQLWAMSFAIIRRMPLFGLGSGLLPDEILHDAHSSFVQAYAELGFFGGTIFLGMFACSCWGLIRLGPDQGKIRDPRLRRMRAYLFGIVAGYAVGLISLTRNYIHTTYLIPGLVAAYLRLAAANATGPLPLPRCDRRLAVRLIVTSAAALGFLYIYVRLFARFG